MTLGDLKRFPGFFVVGVMWLWAPATALPCSCATDDPSACVAAGGSTAVFVGTPVSVADDGGRERLRFRFEVETAIKDVDQKVVDVTTEPDTAACGYPFKVGTKYLVYAIRTAGGYTASYCSRTGPFEARQNDVELLLQQAAGRLRPRLFGVVYRLRLLLNGRPMEHEFAGGLSDVPVRVTGADGTREAHTDRNGRFAIVGVAPGRYEVTLQLPAGDEIVDRGPVVATVDHCAGDVSIGVATTRLRGTLVAAPGESRPGQLLLVVAPLVSGRVSLDMVTATLPESDGTWRVPGLPPGKYVIGAGGAAPPGPSDPFGIAWYPNAATPDAATVIDLTGDRMVSVDFRLPPRAPSKPPQ